MVLSMGSMMTMVVGIVTVTQRGVVSVVSGPGHAAKIMGTAPAVE